VTESLDLEDVLAAADAALGGSAQVRDIGILEAAVARSRATAFGEDAYPDVHTKAAALLHSIVTGHGLVDGNKRLGWTAGRLFYRLNGLDLRMPSNLAYELVMAIADGSVRDVAVIASRLSPFVVDLPAGG
jgi:death-on-curing protein